jgi:hypothetical protein
MAKFERKLRMGHCNCEVAMLHTSELSELQGLTDAKKYVEMFTPFNKNIMDNSSYTQNWATTDLFLVPFDDNAYLHYLLEFRMEVTDLQSDTHLRNASRYLLDVKLPVLSDHVL